MLGYLDNPEKTRDAMIEIDGQRWLKTPGTARLTEEGFLLVL